VRARERRGERESAAGGPYPLVWAVGGGVDPSAGSSDGRSARQLFLVSRKTTTRAIGLGRSWAAPEEEVREEELGCRPNSV
jgi:hypothetical protein